MPNDIELSKISFGEESSEIPETEEEKAGVRMLMVGEDWVNETKVLLHKNCLWCGKEFEWDKTMFQFCDDCMEKLDDVQEMLSVKGHHISQFQGIVEKILKGEANEMLIL